MSINVGGGELRELKPRILVVGVGGAGGNATPGSTIINSAAASEPPRGRYSCPIELGR